MTSIDHRENADRRPLEGQLLLFRVLPTVPNRSDPACR
jgi:hypothetical protein